MFYMNSYVSDSIFNQFQFHKYATKKTDLRV